MLCIMAALWGRAHLTRHDFSWWGDPGVFSRRCLTSSSCAYLDHLLAAAAETSRRSAWTGEKFIVLRAESGLNLNPFMKAYRSPRQV